MYGEDGPSDYGGGGGGGGGGGKRKADDFDLQVKVMCAIRSGQAPQDIMATFNIDGNTYYEIDADKKRIEPYLNKQGDGLGMVGGGDHNHHHHQLQNDGSQQAKRMKVSSSLDDKIEIATYKWYLQMKAKGVVVQGNDIQKAAETIADHLGKGDFKANNMWLHKFQNEHSLPPNRGVFTPSEQSYTISDADCLLTKVRTVMTEEKLADFQVYNADETGLFWKSMPENTIEMKMLPSYEINKQKLTALLCSNADGSHKFKSLVVGNLRDRRDLRNSSETLPVVYKSSTSALMTCTVFAEWFHNSFVPGVRNYQENVLNIESGEVKAVLLLDNAPCHPDANYLRSHDGRIKVILMPSTASSKYQPLEQGVISSCKRLYRKYLLDDCLVFSKANSNNILDLEASANVRSYSIKDALYNWARAWKEVPQSALKNAWSKLLQKEMEASDTEEPFDDLKPSVYLQLLHAAGDTDTSLRDVDEWLRNDEHELGYDEKAVMGIAPVVSWGPADETTSEVDTSVGERSIDLPEAKTAMDHVIRVIYNPKFPKMHKYYGVAKEMRSTITDSILNRAGPSQSMFNLSGRDDLMNYRSCSHHHRDRNYDPDSDVVEVTSSGRHGGDGIKEEEFDWAVVDEADLMSCLNMNNAAEEGSCYGGGGGGVGGDQDMPATSNSSAASSTKHTGKEGRVLSILTRIETKVDVLNYKVDNLERRLDALSSHVAMPVDDDSYSWEELPVRTHEEFELLEAKLKQDNYYKLALERRLMLIGGDSLRSCVKRILEVLLSHEVQLLFNWAGTVGRKSKDQKPKLAFKNTELCPILTRVVVRTNEGTTEDLIHKEVMLYLRGCADRCGGRQRRLQLKMREDSGQGEDGQGSDGGNTGGEDNSSQQGPSSRPHQDNSNNNANNTGGAPSQPAFRPNPSDGGPGGPGPMPPHPFFGSEGFGNHHLLNLSSVPLSSSMQIDHS